MTDMINRIRQLLGIDKSKKRKAQEDSTLANSISKRSRLSNNNILERPFNDDDFYPVSQIEQINANQRRLTDSQMSNHKFGDLFSKQNEQEQHRYYPQKQQQQQQYQQQQQQQQQQQRQLHQHKYLLNTQRQVPDLVKPDYLITNGGTHLTRKEIPSMVPITSDNMFSKIPALYPIQRHHLPTASNYINGPPSATKHSAYLPMVGESMPNGRCVNDNHVVRGTYPSGQSFRSTAQPFLNNVVTARDTYQTKTSNTSTSRYIANHVSKAAAKEEKARFSSLINLMMNPFKSKPKAVVDPTITNQPPIEVVDLATDTDVSKASIISNTSSLSSFEPVNTLRLKLGNRPIVQDGWETELNQRYLKLKQSSAELAQKERDKTNEAESLSKELEEKICNKLKLVELESPSFVYEIKEEEEESDDFPELSDDQLRKIQEIIYGPNSGQVLITKFSISITRHDARTLNWDPLQWLNDEVINFYMELLTERSRQNENLPKVYSMNTFFLKNLLEKGYSAVRRWTRKVDIFSYDVIPIPVHKNIHWCMAIIHFKNKTIRYYDSMGAPDNMVLNSLEEYLEAESLDKRKVPFDKSGWTKENMQGIPQQENGSDCGVFSCMFAEFVARNRPIAFSQQHMQYFRMRMVYEICSGKLLV